MIFPFALRAEPVDEVNLIF